MKLTLEGGDTVTSAPELVRATLNVAAVHTDPTATADRQRLVYGGHTIGVAFAHLTRLVPELVTVLAWRSCDHLAPVLEGDVLRSTVELEPGRERAGQPRLAEIRVRTSARREGAEPVEVLDWRLVGLLPGSAEET
jgi:acyl dehydratase